MNNAWLEQWFSSPSLATGSPARRCLSDVERLSSLDEVQSAAESRNLHVLVSGNQVLLLASGSLTLIC